ncbi:efflux RND transporter periplasmic adaptor subunit [Flavobacterium sp. UBA6031]|uniref:efflux RND transporter periplasmic adaptor subunit n=1 Tax=Flavobacterium sp. UBA6031 TaxID=1946551 RepID=UPI0025BC0129|nr:HlyD family efflux transporter periplasmic adaptor subunit [Flavobacterium sp. UBA6031]
MRNFLIIFSAFVISFMITSCTKQATKEVDQTPVVSVKTTPVKFGEIEKTVSLNGKTVFLKKNAVVSPISGYVLKMLVKFGDKVQKNQLLFELQTKESKALENIITGNAGIIRIIAPASGTINALSINSTGSYVMEGAELCNIIENKDLMVQVNVPFEYNSLARPGTKCNLFLADNTSFKGIIFQVMPNIDETNQTQQIIIKPITNRALPENLNLTVQLVQAKHNYTCLIPRNTLMTNETQTEYWVMKIVNDKIAVKVPVTKGIENDSIVEILSSNLKATDLIISDGAYGMNDSTVVKIE